MTMTPEQIAGRLSEFMHKRAWMMAIGAVSIVEGFACIITLGSEPKGWRSNASLRYAISRQNREAQSND